MNELTDERLVELAFTKANGEALSPEDQVLLARIEASESHRAAFHDYLQTIGKLRGAFKEQADAAGAAAEPLDENTLAEYFDGMLSEKERDRVETRLVKDPHALRQLMDLADLAEALPKASAIKYIIRMAKEGLEWLAHPKQGFELLELRPAQVLGKTPASAVQTWTQQLGPVRMQCRIQSSKEGRLVLSLKLVSPSPPPKGSRLAVKTRGIIIQSEPLPETGEITLRNLEPDTYDVEIVLPSDEARTMTFDLQSGD